MRLARAMGIVILLVIPAWVAQAQEGEPNDSFGSAFEVAVGTDFSGTAVGPGDLDYFEFQADAGMQIRLRFEHLGSALGHSNWDMFLYDNTFTQIGSSQNPVTAGFDDFETITFTAGSTTTYYFLLENISWNNIAKSYFMELEWLNPWTPTPVFTSTPEPNPPLASSVVSWQFYR